MIYHNSRLRFRYAPTFDMDTRALKPVLVCPIHQSLVHEPPPATGQTESAHTLTRALKRWRVCRSAYVCNPLVHTLVCASGWTVNVGRECEQHNPPNGGSGPAAGRTDGRISHITHTLWEIAINSRTRRHANTLYGWWLQLAHEHAGGFAL